MKISQILDKIDENIIFVPAFQREYVWKRENAKNLIGSLMNEYPTGTMLTWETNNPPELKGKWQYDQRQGSVKIILDGQQRITTLYLLIKNKIPPYYKESEILKDPRGIYIHLKKRELQYYKEKMMKNDPYWVNITDIFQKKIRERDITRSIQDLGNELTREEEDKISDSFRAIEKIPDLDFVEQSVPIKATLKEAIDIFYIVNSSGVNLTDAELALAQISGYWPEARESFKEKLNELKEEGFKFKLDFIVYCLLGILHKSGSDMSKLHDIGNQEKVKEVWKKLDDQVLDYIVNLLRSHAYVDHTDEINSVYALIPIIVFVYYHGEDGISENKIKKIIKWFYYSQIRQRYISQLPQKLDKDIKIVVNTKNPFDELIRNIEMERRLEITPEEFIGIGTRHALYSLMRWYFKSKNAICLTTGIGIKQNMGKKYALEWDHIFPYSLLKERGYNLNNRYKYSLAQEITNRVVLTQVANRKKSNKKTSYYLSQVKENFPNSLKLQVIPENEELWKLDNFELFLQERRRMLAEELNDFLEKLTKTEESNIEVSIDQIITEGESEELEFKSSIRWNYKAEMVDKKMENVIMKSICAFGNGQGGKLIIGVDDEGEILGLDYDFNSLGGDKDKFELHLRNLINDNFGKVFATNNIKINFETINDNDICVMEIKKSIKPLYVEISENNQKAKRFYVRSGNTSQELSIEDINEYISSRF
jgi:hypothetical protein